MLTGAAEAEARLGHYLAADAPVAVADPALLAPGAPEAAALATLGARPRVDCSVLLTDAPGRVPARDPLDRGRARPAPPARAGARRLAGRGLPGAAPRARSEDRGAPPGDPPRSRARGARHLGPARPGASRRPGGGRPRRVRVPGARPGLSHGDRAVRAPADDAPPADLPARRRDLRVHRPRPRGPGRPRRARDRPVRGPRDAGGRRPAGRLPPPRVRGGRRVSISPSSGWPRSPSTPGSGRRGAAARQARGHDLAADEGVGAGVPPRDGAGAPAPLRRAAGRRGAGGRPPTRPGSTSSRRRSRSRRRRTSSRRFAR